MATQIIFYIYISSINRQHWERPYQHDSTASRLLSEVKHARAQLVLRWGTTLESWVLFSFCCILLFFYIFIHGFYTVAMVPTLEYTLVVLFFYLRENLPLSVWWKDPSNRPLFRVERFRLLRFFQSSVIATSTENWGSETAFSKQKKIGDGNAL